MTDLEKGIFNLTQTGKDKLIPEQEEKLEKMGLLQYATDKLFWSMLHWDIDELKTQHGIIPCFAAFSSIVYNALGHLQASEKEKVGIKRNMNFLQQRIKKMSRTYRNWRDIPQKDKNVFAHFVFRCHKLNHNNWRYLALAGWLAFLRINKSVREKGEKIERSKREDWIINRTKFDGTVLQEAIGCYPSDEIPPGPPPLRFEPSPLIAGIQAASERFKFKHPHSTTVEYTAHLLEDLFGINIKVYTPRKINLNPPRSKTEDYGRPRVILHVPMNRKNYDQLMDGVCPLELTTYDIEDLDITAPGSPVREGGLFNKVKTYLKRLFSFLPWDYRKIPINYCSICLYDILTNPTLKSPTRESLLVSVFLLAFYGQSIDEVLHIQECPYEQVLKMDPEQMRRRHLLFFDPVRYWLIYANPEEHLATPKQIYLYGKEKRFIFRPVSSLIVIPVRRYPFLVKTIEMLRLEKKKLNKWSASFFLLTRDHSGRLRKFTVTDLEAYFQQVSSKYQIQISTSSAFSDSVFANLIFREGLDPILACYLTGKVPRPFRAEFFYNNLRLRKEVPKILDAVDKFFKEAVENISKIHFLPGTDVCKKENIFGEKPYFTPPPNVTVGSALVTDPRWAKEFFYNTRETIKHLVARLQNPGEGEPTKKYLWKIIEIYNLFTIYNFLGLLCLTVTRPSELANLIRDDITFFFKLLLIRGETNSYCINPRSVPLCDTGIEILKNQLLARDKIIRHLNMLCNKDEIPVFCLINIEKRPVKICSNIVQQILNKYQYRVGSFPREINCFRHFGTTKMRENGWTLRERSAITGRATEGEEALNIYSEVELKAVHDKFRKFAGEMGQTIKIRPINWEGQNEKVSVSW